MPYLVGQSCATRRRSRWIGGGVSWVLALFCFLYGTLAVAAPPHALVLLSETGGVYGDLMDSLKLRLKEQALDRLQLEVHLAPDSTSRLNELLASRPALIVPVGIRATALALREAGSIPVLSLLVPLDSYASLIDSSPRGDPTRASAIYLDQPLERQLDLLKLLLPNARHVATLSGQNSRRQVAELERLCRQRGLQLITQPVASGDNPVPALARLMDQADVLLALPDPTIFNRSSVQAILLTTYRSDVPVLGFSQAYVRAGALAAVHSSAGQIGRQAGEWIAELAISGDWKLGAPRYPRYYSVAVNAQVAQSLGISVDSEEVLLERLQEQENLQP